MYIFVKNGEMQEAPQDFDPKNLTDKHIQELQGVSEVLYVSKRYVPEIKLVPKNPSPAQSSASSTTSSTGKKGSKQEK